jgi:hypothetical protein
MKKRDFYHFFDLAVGSTPRISISALPDNFHSMQHKKLQPEKTLRIFSFAPDLVEKSVKINIF